MATSEVLVRLSKLLEKLPRFVRRHRWSLPLSLLSTICFVQLASELREDELQPFDTEVAQRVQALRGSADAPMLLLTHAGAGLPMTAVVVVGFALLLAFGKRREASFLVVAAGGTGLLNTGLKLFFRRARPEGELLYLIHTPASFSFPSGHAMGSTGVMLSVLVVMRVLGLASALRWGATLVAASFMVGVAWSRVYLGVHFPSDVIGGQLAAAGWVSAVTGWFYPRLLPGEASTASDPAKQ